MRNLQQSTIWVLIAFLVGGLFLPFGQAEKPTVTIWVGDWWKDNVPKIIQE